MHRLVNKKADELLLLLRKINGFTLLLIYFQSLFCINILTSKCIYIFLWNQMFFKTFPVTMTSKISKAFRRRMACLIQVAQLLGCACVVYSLQLSLVQSLGGLMSSCNNLIPLRGKLATNELSYLQSFCEFRFVSLRVVQCYIINRKIPNH